MIFSFLVAAALLSFFEGLAWKYAIAPHAKLVRRVPVQAVVVGKRIDEVGSGSGAWSYPRVLYRYLFDGRDFESSVIRHPNFVVTNGEEARGEVRFYGPERDARAQDFLKTYSVGQQLKAWVNPRSPAEAMLVRQALDISPFLYGILPAVFVPFVWTFSMGWIMNWTGTMSGRWIAFGWAILFLAGFCPVCWQYRQLLDPFERTYFVQLQDIVLGLASVILVGSLLPTSFRAGLTIALTLSFSIAGAVAVASVVFVGLFGSVLGWKLDPGEIWLRSSEFALVGGVALGLLLGLSSRRGLVRMRPMDEINSPAEPNVAADNAGT